MGARPFSEMQRPAGPLNLLGTSWQKGIYTKLNEMSAEKTEVRDNTNDFQVWYWNMVLFFLHHHKQFHSWTLALTFPKWSMRKKW